MLILNIQREQMVYVFLIYQIKILKQLLIMMLSLQLHYATGVVWLDNVSLYRVP